ncbi:winged helix DNA-binding domain-containing protein [Nocardiopsis potens]|uniref:winged helix DNA-binding domain-containing protein n=1 Tax=Nocardiopsis potens TaxID=1246458 RepID=UPI000345663F|nr:winged helix DNA-binding domain-containing protein [Nocardiopsis potens]
MENGSGNRIDRRTLNRTALERQWLLRREPRSALDAVRRLVAVQAQEPNPPYVGLWTRLAAFEKDDLARLLHGRAVVRSSILRGTQHMAAAEDFRWIRPLVQPVLERIWRGAFGKRSPGLDPEEAAKIAAELLAGRTLSRPELARLLAERWPDCDRTALGQLAQLMLPLVHVPPSGLWGRSGRTPFTLAEEWTGAPMEPGRPVADLIRRYLAAFGPASVRDFHAWSGLSRTQQVFEGLRPELRTFTDDAGRELFDLPDLPVVPADAEAPVRLLPALDNLLVAYHDRTRVMRDDVRRRVCIGAVVAPTVLVDGEVRAMWRVAEQGGSAVLTIEEFTPAQGETRGAVMEEGARLLGFWAPEAEDYDIRFTRAE